MEGKEREGRKVGKVRIEKSLSSNSAQGKDCTHNTKPKLRKYAFPFKSIWPKDAIMKFIKEKKKPSRIKAELHWYERQQRGKCKEKTNNPEDKNYYFLVAILIPKLFMD